MADATLTIVPRDLAWALRAALAHAGRDKYLPSLCAVRVEVEAADKTIWCIATDRYTMGAAMLPMEGQHEQIRVTVAAAEVRMLLPYLKGKDPVPVEFTPEAVVLDDFYRFRTMTHTELPGMKGPLVKWRDLLSPALRAEAIPLGAGDGLNPAYLARFRLAARGGTGGVRFLTVRPGNNSRTAMALVLADSFIGAAMATRLYDGTDDLLGDWRDRIHAKPSPETTDGTAAGIATALTREEEHVTGQPQEPVEEPQAEPETEDGAQDEDDSDEDE